MGNNNNACTLTLGGRRSSCPAHDNNVLYSRLLRLPAYGTVCNGCIHHITIII